MSPSRCQLSPQRGAGQTEDSVSSDALIIRPPAQFAERDHDVGPVRFALLQRAMPAFDLRQLRPVDLQFEVTIERGAGCDVGERQGLAIKDAGLATANCGLLTGAIC